jgi:hypothetical protein
MGDQRIQLPWDVHPVDLALYAGLRKLADLAGIPDDERPGFYEGFSGVLFYFLQFDLRNKLPPRLNNEALFDAEEAIRRALTAFSRLSPDQERLINEARYFKRDDHWWKSLVLDDDTEDDPGAPLDSGLFYYYLLEVTIALGRLTGKPIPILNKTQRYGAPKGARGNIWLASQLIAHLFMVPWAYGGNLTLNEKDESKGAIPEAIEILDSIFHFPARPSLETIRMIKKRCIQLCDGGRAALEDTPGFDIIRGGPLILI